MPWIRQLATLALAAGLAACASTGQQPASAGPPEDPMTETLRELEASKLTGLPEVSLFCHPGATEVPFSRLGLGRGELPSGLALTPEHVWVLFAPARLVRISRAAGEPTIDSVQGVAGEEWMVMDADPNDGSAWVVARDFGLVHFGADLEPLERIRLSREVVGKGVLSQILVGGDALYAEPACGEFGAWRLARDGKVLGTDFRAWQPEGPVDPDTMNCSGVRMMRDALGRIVAWNGGEDKALRAEDGGAWTEIEPEPYRQLWTCGAPPAENAEPLRQFCNRLAFWKGSPLFLDISGFTVTKTRIVVPGGGGPPREILESCRGLALRSAVTDPAGYAAVTKGAIVFGDFAHAPDLP